MAQSDHTRSSETGDATAQTDNSLDAEGSVSITPFSVQFKSNGRDLVEEHLATCTDEDGDVALAREVFGRYETRLRIHSREEAEAVRRVLATVPVDPPRLAARTLGSMRRVIGTLDDAMADCGYRPVFGDELAVDKDRTFQGYDRG